MKHPELCRAFMRGQECDETCVYEHVEKANRPYCDVWFATSSCQFGENCFFPHVYPKHLREKYEASFAVQVPHSMTTRVREFLADAIPRMNFAPDVTLHGIHETKGHGFTRLKQRVLLVNTVGPRTQINQILLTLGSSPVLRNAVTRGYLIDFITDEWDEVLEFAKSNLKETGLAKICSSELPGKTLVTYRTHCYPNTLEDMLTAAFDGIHVDIDVDGVAHQLEFVPKMQQWEKILHLVYVDGYYYCGISIPNGPTQWGHIPSKNVIENAVCRAQYKLSEAMIRTGVFQKSFPLDRQTYLDSRGIMFPKGPAIDIGASPGGWSVFLSSQGYSPVYAVDPGILTIDADQHKSIIHLRMLGQEAIQSLKRAESYRPFDQESNNVRTPEMERPDNSASPGASFPSKKRISAYTCDANVSTTSAVEIFQDSVSLLAPRSPVVITLKNFDGPKPVWMEKVRNAKKILDQYCDQGDLIHLMSNGLVEVTYIGWVKESIANEY